MNKGFGNGTKFITIAGDIERLHKFRGEAVEVFLSDGSSFVCGTEQEILVDGVFIFAKDLKFGVCLGREIVERIEFVGEQELHDLSLYSSLHTFEILVGLNVISVHNIPTPQPYAPNPYGDGRTVFGEWGDLQAYLMSNGYVVGRSAAMKKFRPVYKTELRYHVVVRVSLVQAVGGIEVDHYRREFDIGDLYFVTTKKGNTKTIISKRIISEYDNRFFDSSKGYLLGGNREVLG